MVDRLRKMIYGDRGHDDMRARRAMHEFANEVQGLHAVVHQIKQSPDPWHELVRAIRYGGQEDYHNNGAVH